MSEVLDIDGSFERSTPLKAGDHISIQTCKEKYVDEVQAKCIEIQTTEGLRHSFGKTIIGQLNSDYYQNAIKAGQEKDASDGVEFWVVEKEAEGTGRMMLALQPWAPKAQG